MPDPTTGAWMHPYSLAAITPLVVAVTLFYMGAVIWLHEWRRMWASRR